MCIFNQRNIVLNMDMRMQYEESLFKCEDDRFELDMLIETNASTTRWVPKPKKIVTETECETLDFIYITGVMSFFSSSVYPCCFSRESCRVCNISLLF
jgi:histone deacetylase complex regulatory component SIN3